MCNMTEEEVVKMLERGYMTDEESEEIRRDGEEAWEEYTASPAEEEKMRREYDEQEKILRERRAAEDAEFERLLRLKGKKMDSEGWIHDIHP